MQTNYPNKAIFPVTDEKPEEVKSEEPKTTEAPKVTLKSLEKRLSALEGAFIFRDNGTVKKIKNKIGR